MDAAVIIVGAGPTGLTLAGELRLVGVDVLVVERTIERCGQSRGVGLTTRTMEVLDQRGLLPRFGELDTGDFGHFGGIPVDFGVLGSALRAAKTVPQSRTEQVLEDWALDLGTRLQRDATVTDVLPSDDHVEVLANGRRLRAGWVVGCDGGRSVVRKAVGFDFPGTDATRELLLADVRGIQVRPRMIGAKLPAGMAMAGVMPDATTRLIVSELGAQPRKRSQPLGYDEVAQTWQRVTGEDVSHGDPVWVSAFGNAARQASRYRKGRVLLAGDAAHIHLAAGGQGMNTGIQDAVNLGWKLAAVVRGTAPESLVDTYHDERHPVGQRLLMNTQAQGHLILSGPEVAPLREVLGELAEIPEVRRHLAAMVSGLEIRYDVGAGTHPLLGARMPHWELAGTNPGKLLRHGRGVLLDLTDNPALRARAAGWTDRVDIVTRPRVTPDDDTTAVLVRPDGHVAWAAPGTRHDLPSALARWFGPSSSRTEQIPCTAR